MATRRKHRSRGLSGTPARHRENAVAAAKSAKSAYMGAEELAYNDQCSDALESLTYAHAKDAIARYDFEQGKSENVKLMSEVRDAQDKAVRRFFQRCMIKSKL